MVLIIIKIIVIIRIIIIIIIIIINRLIIIINRLIIMINIITIIILRMLVYHNLFYLHYLINIHNNNNTTHKDHMENIKDNSNNKILSINNHFWINCVVLLYGQFVVINNKNMVKMVVYVNFHVIWFHNGQQIINNLIHLYFNSFYIILFHNLNLYKFLKIFQEHIHNVGRFHRIYYINKC